MGFRDGRNNRQKPSDGSGPYRTEWRKRLRGYRVPHTHPEYRMGERMGRKWFYKRDRRKKSAAGGRSAPSDRRYRKLLRCLLPRPHSELRLAGVDMQWPVRRFFGVFLSDGGAAGPASYQRKRSSRQHGQRFCKGSDSSERTLCHAVPGTSDRL